MYSAFADASRRDCSKLFSLSNLTAPELDMVT